MSSLHKSGSSKANAHDSLDKSLQVLAPLLPDVLALVPEGRLVE